MPRADRGNAWRNCIMFKHLRGWPRQWRAYGFVRSTKNSDKFVGMAPLGVLLRSRQGARRCPEGPRLPYRADSERGVGGESGLVAGRTGAGAAEWAVVAPR